MLGFRIKELRERRGWKRSQLAKACRVAPSTIHRIESDKARPTVDTALKIAAALGVPFHDLIQARITP